MVSMNFVGSRPGFHAMFIIESWSRHLQGMSEVWWNTLPLPGSQKKISIHTKTTHVIGTKSILYLLSFHHHAVAVICILLTIAVQLHSLTAPTVPPKSMRSIIKEINSWGGLGTSPTYYFPTCTMMHIILTWKYIVSHSLFLGLSPGTFAQWQCCVPSPLQRFKMNAHHHIFNHNYEWSINTGLAGDTQIPNMNK